MDGAGAALAGVAPDMGAGEIEALPQRRRQQGPTLRLDAGLLPFTDHLDCGHLFSPLWAEATGPPALLRPARLSPCPPRSAEGARRIGPPSSSRTLRPAGFPAAPAFRRPGPRPCSRAGFLPPRNPRVARMRPPLQTPPRRRFLAGNGEALPGHEVGDAHVAAEGCLDGSDLLNDLGLEARLGASLEALHLARTL